MEEDDARPARGGNVIDLMAALKKSLDRPAASNDAGDEPAPAKKPSPRKAAVPKAAAPEPKPKPDPAPAKKAPARKRA